MANTDGGIIILGVGEKAGTGISKIFENWHAQHWRQPSITEEHQPSPRTIVKLQMLDLFDPGVIELLQVHFGKQFDQLNTISRTAIAVTFTEGRLTHQRLTDLTSEHPSDMTKALKLLVAKGLLETTGSGKGTVYRLKGVPSVSPEDVFSHPSHVVSSPHSDTSSPHSDTLKNQRDEHGRLLTEKFHLPFIDSLEAIEPEFLRSLDSLASEATVKARLVPDAMKNIIENLADGHFIRLDCLASLVHRSAKSLQENHLKPLCQSKRLRMAFPDIPNHPDQAYTKA